MNNIYEICKIRLCFIFVHVTILPNFKFETFLN